MAILVCEPLHLTSADFSHTDLEATDLQGAVLTDCILKDANLHKANLKGAIGLSVQQVKSAKNWSEANFDSDFRAQLEADSHPLSETDNSKHP